MYANLREPVVTANYMATRLYDNNNVRKNKWRAVVIAPALSLAAARETVELINMCKLLAANSHVAPQFLAAMALAQSLNAHHFDNHPTCWLLHHTFHTK